MPPGLVKVQQKFDALVDAACTLEGGKKTRKNDAAQVAFLFRLCREQTSRLPARKSQTQASSKGRLSLQNAGLCFAEPTCVATKKLFLGTIQTADSITKCTKS
ncbi:hypothetical protein [Polaromonas sp. CG9_12]|nr:hypothetical protein [Polaromonas sp. CG9_12]